jgi:hypothetical protein
MTDTTTRRRQRCATCGEPIDAHRRTQQPPYYMHAADADAGKVGDCADARGDAPIEPVPWAPGTVTLWMGLRDGRYPQYAAEIDQRQRWNGFACPRFTREVAEQVAIDSCNGGDYKAWRWDGDVLVLVPDEEISGYTEEDRWAPDDTGKYHVGSWQWCWDEPPTVTARVVVPGTMYADILGGEVVRWSWTPSAGYAGYFGPAATLSYAWRGDNQRDELDGEEHAEIEVGLDLDNTDGPFWHAVQQSIIDGKFAPDWSE